MQSGSRQNSPDGLAVTLVNSRAVEEKAEIVKAEIGTASSKVI